jgi:hypothetical protein
VSPDAAAEDAGVGDLDAGVGALDEGLGALDADGEPADTDAEPADVDAEPADVDADADGEPADTDGEPADAGFDADSVERLIITATMPSTCPPTSEVEVTLSAETPHITVVTRVNLLTELLSPDLPIPCPPFFPPPGSGQFVYGLEISELSFVRMRVLNEDPEQHFQLQIDARTDCDTAIYCGPYDPPGEEGDPENTVVRLLLGAGSYFLGVIQYTAFGEGAWADLSWSFDVELDRLELLNYRVLPDESDLLMGETAQLGASAALTLGETANLTVFSTWASDAPGIASVDEVGLVTAHAVGRAGITATWEDEAATATVTVSAP